jgi:glutamate racemase
LTTIGCFHAHHTNIEHIEQALESFEVELIHFVDPGLDRRKNDAVFSREKAEKKVAETLEWIAGCRADAILVTCTFFTSVYRAELHRLPIPVVAIDDPLFREVCRAEEPQILVFTNPNTVQGTMDRMYGYAAQADKNIRAETRLLNDTFELIMQGKKEAYLAAVTDGLCRIAADNPGKTVVAAQLSMAPAARQAELTMNRTIGNPLVSLAGYMEELLGIQKRRSHQ